MQALILCLDISESMAYGEPSKLNQAVNVIHKAFQSVSQETPVGLITFDVTAEVLADPKPSNYNEIEAALGRIVPRGVTCLAAGLTETFSLLQKSRLEGDVLLLTDGRANLSLNRMGGFEGSLDLEEEILKIAKESSQKNIVIHTVAVGEDAFTHTLVLLTKSGKGRYWLAEDFQGFAAEPPPSPEIIKLCELKVHKAPAELPSAQPTWTKESQLMHVAVVSQSLYETYRLRHRAFLVNPLNSREARTALIPIESEVLAAYRERTSEITSNVAIHWNQDPDSRRNRERRSEITNDVRKEEAILLDRSYRDYLALDKNALVKLGIY